MIKGTCWAGLCLLLLASCGGDDEAPAVDAARAVDAPPAPDSAVAPVDAVTTPDALAFDGAPAADAFVGPDAAPLPDAGPVLDATPCSAALNPVDDGSGSNGGVGLPDLLISEMNPGDYLELFNTTGADIPLSGVQHQLCSPFAYVGLASLAGTVTVPAGGFAQIPWPSQFVDVDAGGEVILYVDNSFSTNTSILDFICWGVNPHGSRKGQAEAVGKWSGNCAGVLIGGAIHRVVGTTGIGATDYDTAGAPSPETCAP